MKWIKFVGILLILSLFSATFAGFNVTNGKDRYIEASFSEEKSVITFEPPTVFYGKNYAIIKMKNASFYTNDAGCPMLPVFTKTLTFPLGTKIKSIKVIPDKIEVIKIKQKISPAIGAIPLNNKIKIRENRNVYESTEPYPNKWFAYHIGIGLYNGQRVIFLALKMYPVRYYAAANVIEYAKEMKIKVIYEEGKSMEFNDEYDLVIIAPSKFTDSLQPLVEHKNSHGMKTLLVTTEEIYSNYDGRDDAEKIKYFIKDAIEQYGIKYVLLFGGMKGQRLHKWYVPVRYTNLDDNSSWETGYISDLYFADIYKYEDGQLVFDDWDSNGNGKFAEWTANAKDILDLYPDVYVGRLPARNEREVKIMVNKIIEYESSNVASQEWFKRMVAIGGDSFPDIEVGTDYIEGQVECDQALSYMEGFEHIRIYVEGGDINFTPENAENVLSQGEGFVYFSGHGNPASWATHPHNDFETWIDFSLKNIMHLSNGNKLPVLVVGGCHNCQFNVSVFRLLTEGIWAYWLGEATPECWGWLMTRNPRGGSIATIGNTGLGYGTIGDGPVDEVPDSVPDGIPDCIQYLGGWLEPHFFEVYAIQGKDILGETWGTAIIDYINQFPIDWSKEWSGDRPEHIDLIDCKTVQEWVLFGDPSLKIGGYS